MALFGGRKTVHVDADILVVEKPAGLVDVDPMRGTEIPWSVKRIWALEPGTAIADIPKLDRVLVIDCWAPS